LCGHACNTLLHLFFYFIHVNFRDVRLDVFEVGNGMAQASFDRVLMP